jgi:Protein of unknown function DUF262/Protein of unknown function (DUF1524)
MAKHNLLDTNTVNLNDIFANGRRYKVPVYQRDYSWQDEHWDDLWDDIKTVRQVGCVHYMGAIVLQDHGDKSYSVIDGQQRLATLSILALAVIKRIQDLIEADRESKPNEERKNLLMTKFVGSKDTASLHYSSKLFLNENNDSFYQSYLLQLRDPINRHRLSDSNKLLWRAFEYFYQKVKEFFGQNVSGEALADFIDNQVAERLMFIQIVVEDELNAYTVFETLNARGLELTTTDLLKNYLLALCATSDLDRDMAKEQWQRIIQLTDLDAFPQFLRYYWNSRHDSVRKESLFKALRQHITNREQAFSLLNNLEKYAGVYVALENPNDELWGGIREVRKRVQELKLFNITQCYTLLMEAWFKLSQPEFERVLRICSVISFRYNVIGGLNPKVQEHAYNRAARKIYQGEITKAAQVMKELKDVYPSDEVFISSFSTKTINTKSKKKLARYILFSIENQLAGTDRNYEDESATIEHILPENPSQQWTQNFSPEEQAAYVYRIGNLTLLETSKNSTECRNLSYAEKLPIYKTSQYVMTNSIDYPDWSPEQIRLRQGKLAKLATAVWRI